MFDPDRVAINPVNQAATGRAMFLCWAEKKFGLFIRAGHCMTVGFGFGIAVQPELGAVEQRKDGSAIPVIGLLNSLTKTADERFLLSDKSGLGGFFFFGKFVRRDATLDCALYPGPAQLKA